MILRLALLVVVLPSRLRAKDGPANCKTRIDVVDGAELNAGLALLFKQKTNAMSAEDCALTCFHMKCDVAYFHSSSRVCQFSGDSASSTFSLGCNRFMAEPTATTNGDADHVSRFCIRCSDTPSQETEQKRLIISKQTDGNKARSYLTKRITIPIRPGTKVSLTRSLSGSWQPAGKKINIPSRPSSMQRFVVRGLDGNFTLSRQPMRLKFNGPRLGKSGRSLRKNLSSRYFHRQSKLQNRLKRKGNGIARRKK